MAPATRVWPAILPWTFVVLCPLVVTNGCRPSEESKSVASQEPARLAASADDRTSAAALAWGSEPDAFGDMPDIDGYYSSRDHFDSDSPDRLRRALLLLEQASDGSLSLRLSKRDIDVMPEVEEILQRVHASAIQFAEAPLGDIYHPTFQALPRRLDQPSDGPVAWTLIPPGGGSQLFVQEGEFEGWATLRSREVGSDSDLWQESLVWAPDYFLEFSRDQPRRFLLFDSYSGGAVFDLRDGLVCKVAGPSGKEKGDFGRWPGFVDSGRALILLRGEILWRLSLDSCRWKQVGTLTLPPMMKGPVDSLLVRVLVSPAGSSLLAKVREAAREGLSPSGLLPKRLLFIHHRLEADRLVEVRRVAARLHNALSGTEDSWSDSTADPFVEMTVFRRRSSASGLGAFRGDPSIPEVSFLLLRNSHGRFFAFRDPTPADGSPTLDHENGWLWYKGSAWDLNPLADWSGDDTLH